MSAPILDQLRSVAHDAGKAAGAAVTEMSGTAADVLQSVDVDRFAEFPAAVVGGVAGASTRKRNPRRILIIAGAILAAGIVTAVIVRSRRNDGHTSPDQTSTPGMDPAWPASDGQRHGTPDQPGAARNPELASLRGG